MSADLTPCATGCGFSGWIGEMHMHYPGWLCDDCQRRYVAERPPAPDRRVDWAALSQIAKRYPWPTRGVGYIMDPSKDTNAFCNSVISFEGYAWWYVQWFIAWGRTREDLESAIDEVLACGDVAAISEVAL